MKHDFESTKHDEEFESFYKRYRANVAKARRWEEANAAGPQDGGRREKYSEFQKEMLRRQHEKQTDQASVAYFFSVIACLTAVLFVAMSSGR